MSRTVRRWLLVAGAAAAVVGAVLVARGGGETPTTIDDRVQTISAGLRCPVCQNLSVADSPSPLAREMRAEIERQLRAGRTEEDVRAFFVERYGEWVLLEPASLVPWVVPGLAVLVGVGAWAAMVRRRPLEET